MASGRYIERCVWRRGWTVGALAEREWSECLAEELEALCVDLTWRVWGGKAQILEEINPFNTGTHL
ncbi:hypothetical protein E2C01_099032 [Portunus trituberculatus]|uniref:Uncharacterized protein n=1 Tax=Portunus trituberculatus TaxID=210409 RepID=A0A5B7K9R8_PORTR|nr:hypothetical protein [Portunus trituberculatus]